VQLIAGTTVCAVAVEVGAREVLDPRRGHVVAAAACSGACGLVASSWRQKASGAPE